MVKIYIFLSIATLVILFLLIYYIRPYPPKQWFDINIGMDRSRVLMHIYNIKDLRDDKGFDMTTQKNQFPYYMNGYWEMHLYYDEQNKLKNIAIDYIDRNFGMFNKTISK